MGKPGVFRRLNRILNWIVAGLVLVMLLFVAVFVYDSTRPAISVLMINHWIRGKTVDRQWIPLADVSPRLIDSVVMSEDGQFCSHNGVDWHQLQDVMDDPDGPARGASTITMQVARNLFLWNGRSFIRKGLEIPLALLVDALWSKKHILEVYLNIAEWGDGIFGAEAAARHDFNKSAAQLTTREAALLATALPNPFLRNPAKPSRNHRYLAEINTARTRDAAEWTSCLR
ncbi:monofunctional biosynthetic peptidoglycan transglycosylase [Lichenihabitans psoromatis]|uniref:monofunctional biosynthetic peptidoglycan transglycosylase n=1 Tax=Lichenihabitans psoromatis TaxID=2528642 RepID=UPI001FDED316|nr:monofunctional biosynthetic peptidoglycan transglycosylase [Lichenihabitans psoromatis]